MKGLNGNFIEKFMMEEYGRAVVETEKERIRERPKMKDAKGRWKREGDQV